MSDYHEPHSELDARSRNLHRALASLKEEIEAVDWYHQRVALCDDPVLQRVLAHNRDEEIEHACMTLEWLRRNVPEWENHLKTYLFSEAEDITTAGSHGPASSCTLGIGSLKKRTTK
jgi:ferritin-like protein